MSVHYKFKSALSFDTITFDGLHISIRDLKKAILQQKQIGKASDFDLQITNAQSNEVYEDDNILVPKNSSLIVVRVPLTSQQKKASEKSDVLPALGKGAQVDGIDPLANKLAKTVDLANVEASEADKIQAAITQSTLDYDPSNYLRIKGSNQVGELPANYRCYKCLQPGHWIRDCKLNAQPDSSVDIKKSTGIPRSFMVPVEGPEVPGAMMTPTGQFAVPSIEHEARKEPIRKVSEPVVVEKPAIPSDLVCGVCKDLLADAVLIPCCGNSFCDECIRNVLLESEDHQCPDCGEKDVSPDTLIPNRFLRNSVNTFRNQTGYVKTPVGSKSAPRPVSPNLAPAPPDDSKEEGEIDQRSSPSLSAKDHDSTKDDARSPSDELEIVEDSSSSVVTPFPTNQKQQPFSQGGTIPSLSNTSSANSDPNIPNDNLVENLLPIPNIAVYSQSQPNPKICLKGEESTHHIRKDKQHFSLNRHERSGTPTVDEHNHHMDSSNRYRIESIGGMHPRMVPPMLQPPPMYNHGYMYHQRMPHYSLGPPRGPDMGTYPPGIDDPNMPHLRIPHYGHRPPYNRSRARPPYSMSQNGGQPGSITDPLELFKKILKDKDRRRDRAKRRSRSISRSYSRSPSPRMRPRMRSRTPRSRTRSRSRSRSPRSRTRSRSRSAHYHARKRTRSRSRSFSLSRSPYSDRSLNRSPSRERHFSPTRRREYRHSPNYRTSPPRYYSQKYKEELHGNLSKLVDRRRHPVKPQDYYQSDYSRRNERYETRFTTTAPRDRERDRDHDRDRDREKTDRDREKERYSSKRYDEHEPRELIKYDDNIRALAAQDWEKTRDRELELRKRELREQQDYYTGDKLKKRDFVTPVETIESTSREIIHPPGVMEEERGRVLVDVKREPVEVKAPSKSPEKEKKMKEKKKKKREEVDKKRKKKKKDKSDKKDSETISTNDSIEPLIEDEDEPVKGKGLYEDLGTKLDREIVENYTRIEEPKETVPDKDVVLAPVPELSKWEKDEETLNIFEENNLPGNKEVQVTSEVLKRAENAIFKKVHLKPLESKKPERRVELAKKSEVKPQHKEDKKQMEKEVERHREKERREDRHKDKSEKDDKYRSKSEKEDRHSKDAPRSVALPVKQEEKRSSKHDVPQRISAKERLGDKVEDKLVVKKEVRGDRREIKIEKVPPKSVVSKERSSRDKDREKEKVKEKKEPKPIEKTEEPKILTIDESFVPDYEKSDHEDEKDVKAEVSKPKIENKKRSLSVEVDKEVKKVKIAQEEKTLSTADSSLSSDESEKKHKKKKKSKKHKKKKKKRKHGSSSDSDSSTSSSDSDSEKKRRRHKHKSHKKTKKRKKSKK